MNQKNDEFPFKVTGEINLGTIDLREERDRAIDELNALRKNAEEHTRAIGQECQELRDQLHQKELEVIQLNFQSEIKSLAKMIETAPRVSFKEQLSTFREMAKELGYHQTSFDVTKLAEIIGRVVAEIAKDK